MDWEAMMELEHRVEGCRCVVLWGSNEYTFQIDSTGIVCTTYSGVPLPRVVYIAAVKTVAGALRKAREDALADARTNKYQDQDVLGDDY